MMTFWKRYAFPQMSGAARVCALALVAISAGAQVNVLTSHNDIARTGQNLNETILTPANVNPTQFGKLFSMRVDGDVGAQPLYVSKLTIPSLGSQNPHNVVFLETLADSVFAFDADSNGGIDASPLWSVSLLTNTTAAGTLKTNFGVTGTPVIDQSTNTMFLVSSETSASGAIFRLHALDITSGAEKLGGPYQIQGSIPGTGSGSVGGVIKFDATYQYQRPGLLLLNGKLYVAIGSIADNGPYHGWIFSYNASTLKQISLYCTAPNGVGDGIWMSGSGLAAEVNDPAKPDGRMFVATANGTYSATPPYKNNMSLGMSIVDLDLTGGVMTLEDEFTPYNQALLDAQDGDVGSGGVILLPTQTLASGATLQPLVQVGKSGTFYVLDRNNLGGFNAAGDTQIVQELQTPQSGSQNWGAGVWGSAAYWNGSIYSNGTNPGVANSMTAYSFTKGRMSTTPTSQSAEQFGTPSPTPSVSANGTRNGIVWEIDTNGFYSDSPEELVALDATNLADVLYSSNSNLARDTPGGAVKYTVPTIANGKVYVGSAYRLVVYGLLASTQTAPPPVFSPATATFTGSQAVSIGDAINAAQIYYTTDGSIPTTSSTLYTGPITVTANETITAIASATGYLQSGPAAGVYSSTLNAANPVFSLAAGTYAGTQGLTITSPTPGASIYYTVDGSRPGTGSTLYTGSISLLASQEVRAVATAHGLLPSSVINESYVITPVYSIYYPTGFADAEGPIQFNGSTDLDDIRLQLTNGGMAEAGSAFYTKPVNIQSFTTDFIIQLSNPVGDGMTFTIQSGGTHALGGNGGWLGYAGIPNSVAIKFDIWNNDGEGTNSTGLYLNGVPPTVPAINLAGTGINLRSGDQMQVHLTYDGTILTMTITDVVSVVSWSHSFAVNIPAAVGGNTAYVGFTGGTGGATSSQKVTYWTYVAGPPSVPNFPTGFADTAQLALNHGAALSGTSLQLTNGGTSENTSAYFSKPVGITSFTTDFDFQLTKAVADGFTFVIQNHDPTAVGAGGAGLGYYGMTDSVAMKFDIFSNAGEGNDSTGIFTDGALPTVPAINLLPNGLKLASGDPIHVHITYDGATLSWSMLDLVVFIPAHESASGSVGINIPHTIGSNTAYVGFTGASGGLTAIQDILDWTFTNP